MKVEFSAQGETQVRLIDGWWRENRPAAPDLFTNELDRACLLLEEVPGAGVPYGPKPGVRRLLLRRSHYYLYFVQETEKVVIVAVWSTFRGHGPRL